jgi:lipoprotein
MKNSFIKVLVIWLIVFSVSCGHGNGGNDKKDKPNNPSEPPTTLKKLHVETLTVHKANAISGTVVIDESKTKVEKGDIILEFKEWKPGKAFSITPESISLPNKGDKATLNISTNATSEFATWNQKITVIRSSGMNADKSIEECLATLGSMLTWNNSTTNENIILPGSILGFNGLTITWESSNEKACTKQGIITRDLDDVEVTLTATVKYKGETKVVKFKVTVARIELLTKSKTVNGKPYIYKLDFSKKGTLIISEAGKEKSKHEVKDIDVKTKHVSLTLKETLHENNLVSINDLFAKSRKQSIAITEAQFGALYKKLTKANSIDWDDFKKYIIEIDKAESTDGSSSLDTDEKIFDYVHLRYSKIAENWGAFQALDKDQKTQAIKGFLTWLKNAIASTYNLTNTTEDNIFELISEERKLENEYHSSKLSSTKVCMYVLEKTTDLATYPEGYKFLATAVYDSSKNWNEQHGDYCTEKAAPVNLVLEAGHTMKDGRLVCTLIYEDNTSNTHPYRGVIASNKFEGSNYEGNRLEATLNDSKDKNLSLNITTDGTLKGNHVLKFVADTIGFKD